VSERARRIQTKRALVKGKDKPISLMMVKSGCENQKEVSQLERDGETKKKQQQTGARQISPNKKVADSDGLSCGLACFVLPLVRC